MQKKELAANRDKTLPSLYKEVDKVRLEIAKTKINMATAKEKNLKKVSNLNHDLTQMLTIIREKEILEESKN